MTIAAPPAAPHHNNRQRLHLTKTKRCLDKAGHLYVGLAKARLQHVLTVVAVNLVRVAEWCAGIPVAKTRRSRFAALQAA